MNNFLFSFLLCLLLSSIQLGAQKDELPYKTISLQNFNDFKSVTDNWKLIGDVFFATDEGGAITKPGTGILINKPAKDAKGHLFTNLEHGDIELELDFMMAKNSNSGIYLQGRYELQLFDSWGEHNPKFSDCGGIYQRLDKGHNIGYQGHPPLVNVSKAPGLWQHFRIVFHAPRFNEKGQKTTNARFVRVYQNGVLVQNDVEVTGPTVSAAFQDEKGFGPLMFQGDHGAVAFRDIRYKKGQGIPYHDLNAPLPVGAITVPVESRSVVLRSFVNHSGHKVTAAVSVGGPEKLNYALDLSNGNLLKIWRGDFVETTSMWHSRGLDQLAVPLGSVIEFSGRKPTIAFQIHKDGSWPDSNASYEYQGYDIDRAGRPVFRYAIGRARVEESFIEAEGGKRLYRSFTIMLPNQETAEIWCRPAEGSDITRLPNGLYAINDKQFYIELPDKQKPVIRRTTADNISELLFHVKTTSNVAVVKYSIVW